VVKWRGDGVEIQRVAIVQYRARGPQGEIVHGQLDAESLDRAALKLSVERPELTEIVWVTDPVVPDLDGLAAADSPIDTNPITTPPSVWRSIRRHTPLWLAIVAVHVVSDSRIGTALFTLAAVGYWFLVVLPLVVFRRVQVEKAWGRWDQVRRSVSLLHLTNRMFLRLRTFALAYDLEDARALAGLGRIDEALQLLAKHRGETPRDRARFAWQVIGVYENGRRYDDALAAANEAAQVLNDPAVWLDVARLQAHRRGDCAAARVALAMAEGRTLSEIGAAYRRFVLGIILMEEGAYGSALPELDAAVTFFAWQQVSPGLVELCRLHRALVLARLGRLADARRDLASAGPMMLASGEKALVARVESALAE
jgi:hypothetical protein